MRRGLTRFFLLGLVVVAASVAANAQSRTRAIVTTGQSAPGGGIFAPNIAHMTEKGIPTIAGTTIAFGSDILLNGQTVYGVYVESNGTLRAVTRVGAAAPGGGTITDVVTYAPDRFGNVFVLASTTSNGPDVLLKYSFGFLSRIARVGDTLPDGKVISGFGVALANDGFGGVYFPITYADGNGSALARWRVSNEFSVVAASGDTAPAGGTFGSISPSTLASSTSGLVAFTATVTGGPSGIYTGLEGNLALAEAVPDALPNIALSDNDDVDVAYMRPGEGSIRVVRLNGPETAVASGIAAPRSVGRIQFGEFKVGLAADVEGSIYFFAPITGDPDRGAGLFRRDRFSGEITSLVLQGDRAPSEIGGLFGVFALVANHPTRIANDDGAIVFAATSGPDADIIGVFTSLGVSQGLTPTVSSVVIKKNKLTVTGASFEAGAKILVNGTVLSDTKNNKKNPATKLQSKSGGTTIAPGSTVTITVRNPSGGVSTPVSYTRPR